jgi:uridine phosphorylase
MKENHLMATLSPPFKVSETESGGSWWLGLDPDDVPEQFLLTLALDIPMSDFKDRLPDAKIVSSGTEYAVITGTYGGQRVGVVYHGSGAFSIAVAIEELARLGVRAIVRTGNCGGLATSVEVGDIIITTAAIRAERTLLDYVPLEYPAAADARLVTQLTDQARIVAGPHRVHVGHTVSVGSFYPGSGMPTAIGVLNQQQVDDLRLWQRLGTLNIDAETSTVLVLASLFDMRGAVILGVGNHLETGAGDYLKVTGELADISLNALTSVTDTTS